MKYVMMNNIFLRFSSFETKVKCLISFSLIHRKQFHTFFINIGLRYSKLSSIIESIKSNIYTPASYNQTISKAAAIELDSLSSF